jgi:hypothetical protein
MELSSIAAHRLGGAAAVAVALLLAVRPRWGSIVIGLALLTWGLRSMTHPLPAGDEMTALHEGRQHVFIGIAAAAVGVVELVRAAGRLRHAAFSFTLPAGLVLLGGLFYAHAQHGDMMAAPFLVAQHRVIGATLAIAGMIGALMAARPAGQDRLRPALAVLVLMFGIELLVYTEGGGTDHDHREGSRLRHDDRAGDGRRDVHVQRADVLLLRDLLQAHVRQGAAQVRAEALIRAIPS